MTEKEKELLLMYLANQGLRFDADVELAEGLFYLDRSASRALSLFYAYACKKIFDKISHDICALLHI